MTSDPLIPHLLDILECPEFTGVILAGGFGIRLKQQYLEETEAETLITPYPPARATADFDVFLRIDVIADTAKVDEMGRVLQEKLHYEPKHFNWQFAKPLGEAFPNRKVKIDVLSRPPLDGESVRVRKIREKSFPEPKPEKVGKGAIHGFLTAEAFAIEREPVSVTVSGLNTAGKEVNGKVLIPHPYSFLNMKVRAAHDWLRMKRGEITSKPNAAKHPHDVYALTAMLTEDELERCQGLAAEYADHEVAQEICGQVAELFGDPFSLACLEVKRQISTEFRYEIFYRNLRSSLGCAAEKPL